MRIVWKEDSARAVASSLEQVRQEMEACMEQSRQAEDALREADPDGSNKQLKAIGARFEAAVARLRRAAEEAEQLKDATNHMILAFEDCESEVIHLLNELDPGRGTDEGMGERRDGMAAERRKPQAAVPPIVLPKPRIAPEMRFSALGPTMGWLAERMNHR